MPDLNQHPHFERWMDPESGIESFILKERVAPVQQSFYFTNSSISADEQWLWFYTAFPPNRQRMLGVVSLDPGNPVIEYPTKAANIAPIKSCPSTPMLNKPARKPSATARLPKI